MKVSWHWPLIRRIALILVAHSLVLLPVWADENGKRFDPHPLTAKLSPKSLEAPKGSIEAPSTVIEQVQATEVGQQVQVRVTGSGTLSCVPFRLGNPARLVLDCAGARAQVRPSATVFDLDPVHAVRVGQFKPDVTRVVIDLRIVSPYALRTDGATITVSFETPDRHTPDRTTEPTVKGTPQLLNPDVKAMGSGNPPEVPVDAPLEGHPVIPSPPSLGRAVPSTGQSVEPNSASLKPADGTRVPNDLPPATELVNNTSRIAPTLQAPPMNPSPPITSTPVKGESTDLPRVEGAAREASTSVGNIEAPARDADYVIGPEDVLTINVWHEAELSRSVPVRPDGKISLPLVGDLKASGLTPRALETELARGLEAYIHKPQVTVIIQEVNSHKFYILGEVQRPGSYPLSPSMTVLSALAIAGGFRDFAKVNKIYLLRLSHDGTRTHIQFDYKAAVNGSNSYRDLELKAGDTVVVP